MRSWLTRLCLLVLVVGLSGCGVDKKCAISGTVTRGGEKLTWPDGGSLLVIFFPEDRTRDTNVYRAETETETCAYTVAAIPPGRYKVAVQQFDTKHMDAMNKAHDPVRTTIVVEVTQDGETLDIDIPAGEGARPRPPKGLVPPPPG